MKLTKEQLRQFDEEGYLFFPDYFSPEETDILKTEIPGVFQQRREENVREKTGDVVRTAFAVHTYHPVFEALIHHPRFVEPAEQLLGDKTYIDEPVQKLMRHTGPALSPFNAWVLLKGLETLAVRVQYSNDSAQRIAQFLENHPAVSWVRYPFLESHPQYDLAKRQMTGGGTVITFELKGGTKERAFEVLDKHAPLISALKAGRLKVLKDKQSHFVYFDIQGGFVEVLHNKATVLVEGATPVETA